VVRTNCKHALINIPFYSGHENVLVNKKTPNTAQISDSFQTYGYEINGLSVVPQRKFPSLVFIGFRYINIEEHFQLNDQSYPSSGIVTVRDNFASKNHCYGVQLGAKAKLNYGRLFLDILSDIAFGDNHQILNISGYTRFNNKILQNFGLFSEPTNLGKHTHNIFAIMPQLRIKFGFNVNPYIKTFLAYNGLYINQVIRAGNVIDRNINTSQNPLIGETGILVGQASPLPQFNNTGMWMQGLNIGIEFNG
jgi:hypothetical protein